jgi:hypothetical protein
MNTTIGAYVQYKGHTYMVTEERNHLRRILRLIPTGVEVLQVGTSKLFPTKYKPATVVEYRGSKYLVTAKANIISVTTGKVMKWDSNNGNRVAILALGGVS